MTDRELLEMAAKAAGIEFDSEASTNSMLATIQGTWWSPLTDDGDALQLAVELRIEIRPYWKFVEAESGIGCASEKCKDEPDSRNAATRRAIVLAAAEIGRATP